MAKVLVFTVLLFEFRSLLQPNGIVTGALLALVGVAGALWITGTSLNIVSFLGAIIGMTIGESQPSALARRAHWEVRQP